MTQGQCIDILTRLAQSNRVIGSEKQALYITAHRLQADIDRRRRKDARKRGRIEVAE